MILTVDLSERYCKKYILVRLDLHDLGVGQDVVAGAELAANLSLPVGDVPLETTRGDDAGFLERDDADVLAKDVLLAVLADLDVVHAGLEEECQAGAGKQVDATLGVNRVGLKAVEVMKLAEALVDAAADAAQGDNVDALRVLLADPVDGLAEVGGFLVRVVDDGCGGGLGGVEVADGGGEGVEVADDELEVGLGWLEGVS